MAATKFHISSMSSWFARNHAAQDPQLQLWMSTLDLETQDLVSLPGARQTGVRFLDTSEKGSEKGLGLE